MVPESNAKTVSKMVEESEIEFKGIDYDDVAKFLGETLTKEKIIEEKLEELVYIKKKKQTNKQMNKKVKKITKRKYSKNQKVQKVKETLKPKVIKNHNTTKESVMNDNAVETTSTSLTTTKDRGTKDAVVVYKTNESNTKDETIDTAKDAEENIETSTSPTTKKGQRMML